MEDGLEAGRPGDADVGAEGEQAGERDELGMLRPVSVEMRCRPEESPELHQPDIGSDGRAL
ncbi:hypothetical protein BH18ACT12_BH18ACT12_02270 [soil metagenome]